jgi:hypothetical protein
MGLLSGNSCNIITLLPLGLECSSINASTPQSSNGLVALQVTGGTAPYNITWNNGAQGSLITNLKPGDYTATVVDYYGDFTATTTCTVSYDSFYLEQFEDCSNSGTYVYYLADLVNPYTPGRVYELTTQVGCWTSSGTTLYTGQTYINSYAIYSSAYTDCVSCLPTPTPPPFYPQDLCFEYNQAGSISQINFASGDTINGQPSWTSVTPSYVMYYNSGSTMWTISGWTSGGSPFNPTPSAPPTGSWTIVGPNSFNSSLVVSSGTCVTPPPTLTLSPTNPTCSTLSNGSLAIFGNNGVAPYTYSLDGINYQVSNVFLSMSSGSYTAYIKDSLNSVSSQSFTLTPQQTFQNYNVSLVITPGQIVNVGTSSTRTSNWTVTVSPTPLPAGVTVNMNLIFNVLSTGYTSTLVPSFNNVINTNSNPNANITLLSTSPTTGTSVIRPICDGGNITTSAYTKTYAVQLSTNGFASGTISQVINTPCSYQVGCELRGYLKDSVSIQNITITPTTCRSISTNVTPQQVTLEKVGLIC